jgi:hypothetical protein
MNPGPCRGGRHQIHKKLVLGGFSLRFQAFARRFQAFAAVCISRRATGPRGCRTLQKRRQLQGEYPWVSLPFAAGINLLVRSQVFLRTNGLLHRCGATLDLDLGLDLDLDLDLDR